MNWNKQCEDCRALELGGEKVAELEARVAELEEEIAEARKELEEYDDEHPSGLGKIGAVVYV